MIPHRHESVIHQRRLPHIQARGRAHFITFCTCPGRTLSPDVRRIPIECCRELDGVMMCLHGVVVMPDHVHLVATALAASEGDDFMFSDILRLIKGRSARRVNLALGRRGAVWQAESFDHVLRSVESAESKVEYILMNPVRRGLAVTPDQYPWIWRRSGEQRVAASVHESHVAQASACVRSDGGR